MLFKSTVSCGNVGVLCLEIFRKHCTSIFLALCSYWDYSVDEM